MRSFPLTFLGYGCQEGARILRNNNIEKYLQEGFSISTSFDNIYLLKYKDDFKKDGQNGGLSQNDYLSRLKNFHFHNIISKGHGFDNRYSSLCPGDSGGPVFRESNHNEIVGINAYYSFKRDDRLGISYTNMHARLSPISDWIEFVFQTIKGNR